MAVTAKSTLDLGLADDDPRTIHDPTNSKSVETARSNPKVTVEANRVSVGPNGDGGFVGKGGCLRRYRQQQRHWEKAFVSLWKSQIKMTVRGETVRSLPKSTFASYLGDANSSSLTQRIKRINRFLSDAGSDVFIHEREESVYLDNP